MQTLDIGQFIGAVIGGAIAAFAVIYPFLSTRLRRNERRAESNQTSISKLIDDLKIAQKAAEDAQKAAERAAEKAEAAEARAAAAEDRASKAEADLTKANEEITTLQGQVATLDREKRESEGKREQEHARADDLQKQLVGANDKITGMEGRIRALELENGLMTKFFDRLQIAVVLPTVEPPKPATGPLNDNGSKPADAPVAQSEKST